MAQFQIKSPKYLSLPFGTTDIPVSIKQIEGTFSRPLPVICAR